MPTSKTEDDYTKMPQVYINTRPQLTRWNPGRFQSRVKWRSKSNHFLPSAATI